MSNSPPRSYFEIRVNRKAGLPWDWVEIDFNRRYAYPFTHLWRWSRRVDAEAFWAKLEEAGVWQWTTWEEGAGGEYLAIKGGLFNRCAMRIFHGGRERNIYLDDQPEKIAKIRAILEPLSVKSPGRKVRAGKIIPPGRKQLAIVFEGIKVDIDFDRMHIRYDQPGAVGSRFGARSIAGFDAEEFWNRLAEAGAWDWPTAQSGERYDHFFGLHVQWQDHLSFAYGEKERSISLVGQPQRLREIIELLRPLSFGPLSAMLEPVAFECVYPRFDSSFDFGLSPGRITCEGSRAHELSQELAAIGFGAWPNDTLVPHSRERWWGALEWEEVEDDLVRGLPYVTPKIIGIRREVAKKIEQLGPVPESDYTDGIDLSLRWGVRLNRSGQQEIIEGADERISLVKLLAASAYHDTQSIPALRSASDLFYELEENGADFHTWWDGESLEPGSFFTLEGMSGEETFRYEFTPRPKNGRLIEAEAALRPPAIGVLRSSRLNMTTGVKWATEKPFYGLSLAKVVRYLEIAKAHEWKNEASWPDNAWNFRACLNGKTYECGGITATGGGIESPEPDPRLAVLRKIMHFAG